MSFIPGAAMLKYPIRIIIGSVCIQAIMPNYLVIPEKVYRPFIKSHFGPNIWLSQSIEQGKVYINPVDSFSNKEQDHGDLIKTLSLDD